MQQIALTFLITSVATLLPVFSAFGDNKLALAIQRNDYDNVKDLLARDPKSVNEPDAIEKKTPLMVALDFVPVGDHAIIGLLLEKGASVNAVDRANRTPFYYAALRGPTREAGPGDAHTLTEKLFAYGGAKARKTALLQANMGNDRRSPLHIAAQYFNIPLAQVLLSHGVNNFTAVDHGQYTPLQYAAGNPATKQLFDAYVNVKK